jgi:hypothetical protein
VKETLQSIFESQYSFDLEHFRKQNIGKTIGMLQKLRGSSPFSVAYVTQVSLGGHAIPLGKGEIEVMYIIGAINNKERDAGVVPGLDRAVSKSKGQEFSSLLHQLAAELVAAPLSPSVRSILLEIDPECKSRLPKRGVAKKAEGTDETAGEKLDKPPSTKKKKTAAPTSHTSARSKKRSSKSLVKKSRSSINKKSPSKQLARRKPR